jgi:hypothetical protein
VVGKKSRGAFFSFQKWELIMAKHGSREQKKLAKKKAKRNEKRTTLARQSSNDPTVQLATATSWAIEEALVPENLWDTGIGNLILARRHPSGRLVISCFLVDVFCLGVKNAFWRILGTFEYKDFLLKTEQHGKLEKVAPEFFAKLVYSAVEYAHSFGFLPHPDYRHAKMLLNGIDADSCTTTFEFGKDGKPFYIAGPHESLATAKSIAQRIQKAGGHYVVPLSPEMDVEPLDEDSVEELEDEEEMPLLENQKKFLPEPPTQ